MPGMERDHDEKDNEALFKEMRTAFRIFIADFSYFRCTALMRDLLERIDCFDRDEYFKKLGLPPDGK